MNVPFPIPDTIDGQYIDMAMPVKKAAMSGEMPLGAAPTLEATEAKDLPGSLSP